MKKSNLLGILFSLAALSVPARAFTRVDCLSTQNSSRGLLLTVQGGSLIQVSGQAVVLVVTKLANQNFPGKTLYSVAGGGAWLLEVDNTILQGGDGQIRLGSESYSCRNE